MGWLRQLGALFWKNYVLRKRHPFILVLEVIWPLAIFAIAVIVKLGIPPGEKPTCSYPERALPSAGLFPFIQSAACTIDNTCSTPVIQAERAASQQRLQALLYDMEPMLSRDTTLKALESLPTISVVLDAIKNSTNATNIKALDDKLRLRNMFTAPDDIIDMLVNKYGVMTSEAADGLMNSTLNVVTLLQDIGYIDFEKIVCTPGLLTDYMVFADEVDVAAVSTELCGIDKDLIPNITNTLLGHLDVANIIRIAEKLSQYTGEFDLALLLSDVAGLTDLYRESSQLRGLLDSMPGLRDSVPEILAQVADLMTSLQKLKEVDFESLGLLYDVVEPMLKSLTSDRQLLDSIRDFLDGAEKSKISGDNGTDWASLLNSMAPLMDGITSLVSSNSTLIETLTLLFDIPVRDLYNIPALLMGNSSGAKQFDEKSINKTLESMRVMLDSMMGNETMAKITLVGKHSLLMAMDIMIFYTDIGESMSNIMKNSAVTDVAKMFVKMGPTNTSRLVQEMVKLNNVDKLIAGELDVKTACMDTTNAVFPDMDPADLLTILDTVCSDNITDMVSDAIDKGSYKKLTSMFNSSMDTMDQVMTGKYKTADDFSVEDLYYLSVDKMGSMAEMRAKSKSQWDEALDVVSSEVTYDFYKDEWSKVWKTVGTQYVSSNLVIMYREVMTSMEGSAMWDVLGEYIQMADAAMATIVGPLRTLHGLDEKTTIDMIEGQVAMYVQYLPDIMTALMNESNWEQQKEAVEKLSSGDTAGFVDRICDDHLLLNLSLPTNVPVADIERLICTTDWSAWLQELGDLYSTSRMAQKIKEHVDKTTVTGIDWQQMGTNMAEILDLMMDDDDNFVLPGMWDFMSKLNMTSPLSSLRSMYGLMANITADQLSRYSDRLAAPMLDVLDNALQNVTIWRFLKHGILAWHASIRVVNDYLVTSQAPGFNLANYVTEISPTLGEYLNNSLVYVPDLMDTITDNLKNPAKMMEHLFTTDWSNICDGASVSKVPGLPPSANVIKFEEGLCKLSWTQIVEELKENNPDMKTYLDEIKILSSDMNTLPDVAVDWKELARSFEDYMGTVANYTGALGDWDVAGLDMDRFNMSWADLGNLFTKTNGLDIQRYSDMLAPMLDVLDNALQNVTIWRFLKHGILAWHASIRVVNDYLVTSQAPGFNLANYVTEISPTLGEYLNNSLVYVPDLMDTITDNLKNPAKMMEHLFTTDWSNICDGASVSKVPGLPPSANVIKFEEGLCKLSWTQIVEELKENNPDMKTYLDEIKILSSDMNTLPDVAVDWKELARSFEDYMETVANYTGALGDWDVAGLDMDRFNMSWTDLGNLFTKTNGLDIQSWVAATCSGTVRIIRGTYFYKFTWKDKLDAISVATEMTHMSLYVNLQLRSAVCDVPTNSLAELVDELKSRSIPERLQWMAEKYAGDVDDIRFDCDNTAKSVNGLIDLLKQTMKTYTRDDDTTLDCMKDAYMKSDKFFADIETLFNTGADILNVLQDDQFREFITTLFGNDDLLKVAASFMDGFLKHEQAVSELEEILLKNITNAEQFLQDAYNVAPDALKRFLNATMNLDMTNITADALIKAICDTDTAELDIDLSTTLCGADRELAENVAHNVIGLARMIDKLLSISTNNTTDWWEVLADDLSELVNDIEGISELANVIRDLGDIDVTNIQGNGDILHIIERLLVDNSPDNLIDSFNAVLVNFEVIDRTDQTANIIDSIKFITRGLLSFQTLRQLIMTNVRLSDLVKSPEELNAYMVETLGLSDDVAAAIIDGSFSFEVLLQASQVDVTEWVCNSTRLAELISMNHTSVDASEISERFCNLDQDTVTAILNEALARISVGELVKELVTNTVNNVLQDAGIDMADIEGSINNINDAQSDFNTIMKRLEDYPVDLTTAFANMAEAQIGSSGLSSLSAVLCGEVIPTVSDDFNVGDKLGSTSHLPDIQERADLPNDYCRDVYTDIMEEREGPVIWSYLKPLIRGKILFAPDIPATRQIVHEMNSTFRTIENVLSVANTWATGSVGLENMVGDELAEIQDLLASPLVGAILTQVTGVSVSRFNNMLYTINDTDPDLVNGMARGSRLLAKYMECVQLDRFYGFDTEAELEQEAFRLGGNNNLLAGIIFTNVNDDSIQKRSTTNTSNLPKLVKYKIRVDLDNIRHTNMLKRRFWRPVPDDNFADDLRYFRGFIQLQDLLDMAIIRVHTGADMSNVSITTQQFPSPCHRDDLYLSAMTSYILPIMITVAWVAGLAIAINNLVYDRENGQEEILKAMGLISWLNWWAWFLSTMLLMAFVAIFAILMLSYGKIFPTSNMLILFLYLLDFCFSATLLCYFVSAFFTRTSLAILVSLIVYLVSYLPYVMILTLEVDMQFWHKIVACLSCTTAFSFGAQYIARFEEQQLGMQWENVRDSPIANDKMNLYWCFIMMVIDGCAYLVLGWYVRNVKSGKFGVSNPWYFPVCPYYWGITRSSSNKRYQPGPNREYIEESTTRQPVVMSVQGLGKTFSNNTTVVENLHLDIHGGEVTTLLGHNGAAKTTTMCMLSGIMEATTGEVRINNRPQRQMKEIIGICPQHNALFEYMTVQEHMEFCMSIKSTSCCGNDKEDIRQLLKDVDLYRCRFSRVGELSGGMQRRLCVAMAFIGRSKVVILDEPTSGIDPSGRRTIWNLIIKRKCRTAIVLSTHHLDEADIISDRIAIMHKGRVMCLGSPMFLKHQLTSGHMLRVLKDPNSRDNNPTAIMSAIQRWVPGARLDQAVTSDLSFTLPAASHCNFYQLFQHLEANKGALQIANFGVSDPTLEEAFMKVCNVADSGLELTPEIVAATQADDENGGDPKRTEKDTSVNIDHVSRHQRTSGLSWKLAQLGAMLTKRFHHYRRNWPMIFSVVILPILLFLVACAVYSVKPTTSDTPNLFLSPAMYGPGSYVIMKDESSLPLSSKVFETFQTQPGIGTSCMDGMTGLPGKFQCVSPDAKFSTPDFDYNPNATCGCDDFRYTCSKGSADEPPKQRVTTTTDILQDLQGRDIDAYLHESFFDFIEQRYGGWSTQDDTTDTTSTPKLKSTVWYNNRGYHAIPSFYNAYTNGLLRASVDPAVHGPAEQYGISAYNHPLQLSKVQLSRETLLQSAADCGIALIILLAFTFIPVSIATYVVHEYIRREKHVQFASGVGPVLYWTASLVWDLLILVVCVGLSIVILAIFQNDSFWKNNNMEALVVLIFLYGWATITFGYCVVKLFKTVSSAFFTLFCLHNFLGMVTVSCIFCLDYYSYLEDFEAAYDVLRYLFLIFPQYAFSGGLINLITNQLQSDVFARFGVDMYTEPFTFDLIGWNCVALGAEGLVFFIVAILLDKITINFSSPLVFSEPPYEDEDVLAERQRIRHRSTNDILTVNNLSKVYRRAGKHFLAVDHISFGISNGECFGLLGVNGAGKTTLFKILTGALSASAGNTSLQGRRVQEGSSRLGRDLGYCPQEEALDLFLTIEEMLYFYAKLRGIPASNRKDVVNSVIDQLNIRTIQNKIVKNCSGGMRRKLSLAIALLGDPSIVLLDEPTTGMDAAAKRLAWRSLIAAREKGQAIILTSHSMEECDILCNRLAIMVNGQFKCLGSPQHLKNKFGDGYTVTLYMCGLSTSQSALFELIQTYFPGSSIRDCHENVLHLDIPKSVAKVSTIFQVLDGEKERFNILYYTVSQTTLETIFLNFAHEQTDSSNDVGNSSASSGIKSNSDTLLAGEPLANARYAYDLQSDTSKIKRTASRRSDFRDRQL